MQSQKRPSGMFDRYLQDDSSSGHYERYESEDADYAMGDDLTDEAEPMPVDEDESEPKVAKPGMMHAQHMKMMLTMIHLMQEMTGMFSEMLKSTPKKHTKPDESEDATER